MKLYGVIRIKGFWLPFAFMALSAIMGADPFIEACGVLVGHFWYFFTSLLPQGMGRQYLRTPRWCALLASKLGMEGAAPPAAAAPNPAASMFRTFRGGGQRLGR